MPAAPSPASGNIGGSVAPVSLPGIPSAAAGIPITSPFSQLLEGIGQAPQLISDAKTKMADDQAKRYQDAAPRIAVLGQMLSTRPELAKDPNIVAAAGAMFQSAGLPLPKMPDGSLDVAALGVQSASQAFVQKNWDSLRILDRAHKEAFAAGSGVVLPETILAMDPVSITNPSQLTPMYNDLTRMQYDFGQGKVGLPEMIGEIEMFRKPFSDIGMGSTLDNMKQQLLSPNTLGPATLAYLTTQLNNGQLKYEQYISLKEKLPLELANLKATGDFKHFEGLYYQAKAQDEHAIAAATIAKYGAEASAAYARADESEAVANKNILEVNTIMQAGGYDPKTLDGIARTVGTQLQGDKRDLTTLTALREKEAIDLNAAQSLDQSQPANVEQVNRLKSTVADTEKRIAQLNNRVKTGQDAYNRASAALMKTVPGGGDPAAAPKTLAPVRHNPTTGQEAYLFNGKYYSEPNGKGTVLIENP